MGRHRQSYPTHGVLVGNTVQTIALCYGTRPQVVKASVLSHALRRRWRVLAVDTGQHYDYELNRLLYEQLEIPPPDHFLEVGSDTPARQTAKVLDRAGDLLARMRPDTVVVIGDTNSTLGCAVAASKLGLPLVHVEAGLRAPEPGLPEEHNRRVVDVLADLLCAPSKAARDTLLNERVPGVTVMTGDVARDALTEHLRRIPPATDRQPFVLATAHRAALTSDRAALAAVLAALGTLELPVVFPMHPRTRAAIDGFGLCDRVPSNVRLGPPLGYTETIAAVRDASAVVTDSGGVQREAYWLGTACVTLRGHTEWTETVEAGANALVRPLEAPEGLRAAVFAQMQRRAAAAWVPDAYGDGRASIHIADAVGHLLEGHAAAAVT
ncbi:MAG: UDP-N-acetyl glucosamine 2-epimerase [Gemmatimonadales bacterium]